MQDRISSKPGRVLITPESGEPFYATMTLADEPSVAGTQLTKATLLSDETATALQLEQADPTVNDALLKLANNSGGGSNLPTGGKTNQVLAKADDADGDVHWVSINTLLSAWEGGSF